MSRCTGFLLTTLILSGIGYSIWRVGYFDRPVLSVEPSAFQVSDQVDVGVLGTKFHWSFLYPGPDGILATEDDVHSTRVLRVPPNVNVRFHITSDDYVYILGIPLNENASQNVGEEGPKIREIAVPALTHFIEHGFNNSGTYDLMVDPLCGFQSIHDPRMGQIIVSDNHDYSLLYPPALHNHEPL